MGCDREDPIQHYATCKHILAFGASDLWLQPLLSEDRAAGFPGRLARTTKGGAIAKYCGGPC